MKIYCINNNGCKLTLGQEYRNIQNVDSDKYIVIADDNQPHSYSRDKFTSNKDLAMRILDRNNNPSEYFEPLCISVLVNEDEYQTNTVSLNIIHIDKALLGIGNLHEFLNINSSYNITLTSSTKYPSYNKTSNFLQIGKQESNEFSIEIYSTNNNLKAIALAYRISRSIKEINKELIYKKKEKKMAYLIEHEPNGKKYYFRSADINLSINQTVYCDTSRGNQYGVIKGIEDVPCSKWYQLKECRRMEDKKEIVGFMV